MKNRWKAVLLLLGALLITANKSPAQTGLVTAVAGSGAVLTENGTCLIRGTLGQSAIGFLPGSGKNTFLGFWHPQQQSASAAAEERVEDHADVLSLHSSPNPFTGSTRIFVNIPHNGNTSLVLFNVLGQPVRTLLQGEEKMGALELTLDADDLPSGRYLLRLSAAGNEQSIPLLLVR